MPIYEYLCQDCAYTFELKQSMKDDPVAVCARCGKSVSRIISAPAIMFKGSGWYVTDYSDKLKPPSGEPTAPAAGAKKESTGTSESAPATAAAAATAAPTASTSGTGTSSAPSTTPASTGSSSSSSST